MENHKTDADDSTKEELPNYNESHCSIQSNSGSTTSPATAPAALPIAQPTPSTFQPIIIAGIVVQSDTSAAQAAAPPLHRGRRRSTTLVGAENPADNPISASDQHLANLINRINSSNRRASQGQELARRRCRSLTTAYASIPAYSPLSPYTAVPRSPCPIQEESEDEDETTPRAGTPESRPLFDTSAEAKPARDPFAPSSASEISHGTLEPFAALPLPGSSDRVIHPYVASPAPENAQHTAPIYLPSGSVGHRTHPRISIFQLPEYSAIASLAMMQAAGYQNYLDSPSVGPNPRQAPPSPSPSPMHQNGINGGGLAMAGGMVGFPTPAGHQSDLNYIMQMVEELSAQLAQNQGLTAGIVEKMGKVRAKAQNLDLSNDELLALAASELNVSSENIEKENSDLRKALEKSLFEKKENWKLAIHGANILSDILDKMHQFKSQHEADTLAWHRNYRKQLADEREENLQLRNQINDMKAAAFRANDHLREMRKFVTDNDEIHQLRVENISLRQQRRLWKRKALPLIPDDDSEWSDDDDIIDPEEKKRKAAEEAEKERKDKEGADGGEVGAIA